MKTIESKTLPDNIVRALNRMACYLVYRDWKGSVTLLNELASKASGDDAFAGKFIAYVQGTSNTSTIFLRSLVDELKNVENSYFSSLELGNDVDGIDTAHLYYMQGDFKDVDQSIFAVLEKANQKPLEAQIEHDSDMIKVVTARAALKGDETDIEIQCSMAGHLALRSNGLLMTQVELDRNGKPAYIVSTWKLSQYDSGDSEKLPKGQRYSYIPKVLFNALDANSSNGN